MSGDAQAEVRHWASVLRSRRLRVGNSWFSSPLLRQDGGRRLMPSDPSWDIMPVVNPALRERKRRRLIRSSCAYDPVGLAEPLYQLRHRDQVVMPSTLDRVSRELLIRAQSAI